MQSDEIALGKELFKRNRLDIEEHCLFSRKEWIIGDDAHAKRVKTLRHALPDGAQTDDADRLMPQLVPLEALKGPPHATDITFFAGLVEKLCRLRQLARQHQYERDREVSDRGRVAPRRRQGQNPMRRARVDVEIDRVSAAGNDYPEIRSLG